MRTRFARSAKVTGVWCQPRSLTTSWRTGAIKSCFGTTPTGSRFARLATTRTRKSGTTNRCDKFGVAEKSRHPGKSRHFGKAQKFRHTPKIPLHPKNSTTGIYGIYRNTTVYTDIHRYIPEYTDIYRHTPAYTGIYRGTPGYIGVHRPGAWPRTHGPGPSTGPDPRTQHGRTHARMHPRPRPRANPYTDPRGLTVNP